LIDIFIATQSLNGWYKRGNYMDKNRQIIMEQIELLADDTADILLKLERRGS